ncbi:hypothetical protein BCE_2924 [Bacillus cereus ATCC 10987]|uniref:Uncharacterized protein n=1 Tax=Bacillus cereus (strain ATCC 10987 / NRS 248) TaxID=222523 RepID=Q736H7_BACC1|nr:hypothetical protein BCE_2924 [Bacillus cereus ATCC 10987]
MLKMESQSKCKNTYVKLSFWGSFFLFKEGLQCKWREGIYKEMEK